MKQNKSLYSSFGDDEFEACEILLELSWLIYESECRRFTFTWGTKRRRSATNYSASSPSVHGTFVVPSTWEAAGPTKVEASSPATPLSFSPSESDEKSKHSKRKVPKQRKTEEWVEIIDGLTQRKELLKGEIQNVKRYYDKLKAFNLELKARKQELLSLSLQIEKPQLEPNKSLNLAMELAQSPVKSPIIETQHHFHQQPFIMDQTAHRLENSENHQHPYARLPSLLSCSTKLCRVKGVGPIGIPDLNASADDSISFDSVQGFDVKIANKQLNRVMAAQARKRRIQIYRVKNSIAASKTRYTYR